MPAGDLFRSDNILLRKSESFSKRVLVVSFDSYTDNPSLDRPGFGEGFFREIRIDSLHVIPKTNLWYQHHEMGQVLETIYNYSSHYENVFTYGSSMGGYAAIRFGARLRATAIAIAPQYSVDPKVVGFENRWSEAGNISYHQEQCNPIEPLKKTIVFYDPFHALDRKHVEMINQDTAVTKVPIPYAGHVTGVYLAEVGMLGDGISKILLDDFDENSYALAARKRRRDTGKYYEVLSNLAREKHPGWAYSLAKKAVEACPLNAGHAFNLAQHLTEKGEYTEAIQWQTRAIDLDPANLAYKKYLAIILLRKNDIQDCQSILEGLIRDNPSEADYYHLMASSFYAQGRLSDAIAFEEKAIERNPSQPGYKIDLDLMKKQLGEQMKHLENAPDAPFYKRYINKVKSLVS